MENLSKLFLASMTALIFVIAISVLFISNREMNKFIDLVKGDIQEIQVLYSADYINTKDGIVEYHELISMLMHGLEYDVKVGHKEIKKEGHNYLNFEFGSIAKKDYKKSYEYDKDGKIHKIIYD